MNVLRTKFLPILFTAAAAIACAGCSSASLDKHLSAKPSVSQLRDGDYQAINEGSPGAEVNLARFAKSGKYTVFEFSSDG